MGSGVSTVGIHQDGDGLESIDAINNKVLQPNVDQLVRLRRAILLRAYNISRKNNNGRELEEQITLAEQLKVCTHRHPVDNRLLIEPSELQKYLSLDAIWANSLFKEVVGNENEIEFKDLIEFLESGKIPNRSIVKKEIQKNIDKDLMISKSTHNTPRNSGKITKSSSSGLLLSPGRIRTSSKKINTENIENDDLTASPSVDSTIEQSSYTDDNDNNTSGLELTLHKNEIICQGPVRPLWRKREVVRQERTVEYITIDADGIKQELVEKEISQTEVLHMECRETGEFAHRETTQYEQLETFNDEIVIDERGTEEYVHLKSLDDEVEYMQSNMPKKEQNPEDGPQQPQSPRVGGQSYNNNNDHYNNNEGESSNLYDQQDIEINDCINNNNDDDEELAQQIRDYMELEMKEGRTPDPGYFIRLKLEKNEELNNAESGRYAHDEDLQELLRLQKEEDEYLAQLERDQEQQDQTFDYNEYQNEIDDELKSPLSQTDVDQSEQQIEYQFMNEID